MNGYQQVTSTNPVDDVNAALDATGLKNPPVNGTFQVLVYNKTTGLTQTHDVQISENGLNTDTSLASLATQLNSISGLSATTTPEGKLTISTTSADQQVAFAGDTSGVLAALGINTFFTGSDALGIAVNNAVVQDPSTFAASSGGVGADTNVAQQLAQFQAVAARFAKRRDDGQALRPDGLDASPKVRAWRRASATARRRSPARSSDNSRRSAA